MTFSAMVCYGGLAKLQFLSCALCVLKKFATKRLHNGTNVPSGPALITTEEKNQNSLVIQQPSGSVSSHLQKPS